MYTKGNRPTGPGTRRRQTDRRQVPRMLAILLTTGLLPLAADGFGGAGVVAPCSDSPADWADAIGRNCSIYVADDLCIRHGQGIAGFTDPSAGWFDPASAHACCGCGGGRTEYDPKLIGLTLRITAADTGTWPNLRATHRPQPQPQLSSCSRAILPTLAHTLHHASNNCARTRLRSRPPGLKTRALYCPTFWIPYRDRGCHALACRGRGGLP